MILACAGVQQAAVYGVRVPGHEGRAGMAALVVDDTFDLANLHRQVAASLPDYARPLFVRLCARLDMTETFKQKSRQLVDEGFDPEVVGEAIYFDDRRADAYVRLDPPLLAQIETGLVRL